MKRTMAAEAEPIRQTVSVPFLSQAYPCTAQVHRPQSTVWRGNPSPSSIGLVPDAWQYKNWPSQESMYNIVSW